MNQQLRVKDKMEKGKTFKIAPFKKEIRKTEPHKHNNYFEIIYLSGGSGIHNIDSRQFVIAPPVIYIVRKEQVHHWEITAEPEGFVLIIKKEFIDNSLDKELKNVLTRTSIFPCVYLKDDVLIRNIFGLLQQEFITCEHENSPVIEGLLKALLAKVLEQSSDGQRATGSKIHASLYDAFLEHLSQDQLLRNNVSYYAAILITTPQNLNAACRKAANQSAAHVLADFIISEAKRLLLYTDSSVLSIAYLLAFSDSSHFVKYFKRHTGQTPNAFRSAS